MRDGKCSVKVVATAIISALFVLSCIPMTSSVTMGTMVAGEVYENTLNSTITSMDYDFLAETGTWSVVISRAVSSGHHNHLLYDDGLYSKQLISALVYSGTYGIVAVNGYGIEQSRSYFIREAYYSGTSTYTLQLKNDFVALSTISQTISGTFGASDSLQGFDIVLDGGQTVDVEGRITGSPTGVPNLNLHLLSSSSIYATDGDRHDKNYDPPALSFTAPANVNGHHLILVTNAGEECFFNFELVITINKTLTADVLVDDELRANAIPSSDYQFLAKAMSWNVVASKVKSGANLHGYLHEDPSYTSYAAYGYAHEQTPLIVAVNGYTLNQDQLRYYRLAQYNNYWSEASNQLRNGFPSLLPTNGSTEDNFSPEELCKGYDICLSDGVTIDIRAGIVGAYAGTPNLNIHLMFSSATYVSNGNLFDAAHDPSHVGYTVPSNAGGHYLLLLSNAGTQTQFNYRLDIEVNKTLEKNELVETQLDSQALPQDTYGYTASKGNWNVVGLKAVIGDAIHFGLYRSSIDTSAISMSYVSRPNIGIIVVNGYRLDSEETYSMKTGCYSNYWSTVTYNIQAVSGFPTLTPISGTIISDFSSSDIYKGYDMVLSGGHTVDIQARVIGTHAGLPNVDLYLAACSQTYASDNGLRADTTYDPAWISHTVPQGAGGHYLIILANHGDLTAFSYELTITIDKTLVPGQTYDGKAGTSAVPMGDHRSPMVAGTWSGVALKVTSGVTSATHSIYSNDSYISPERQVYAQSDQAAIIAVNGYQLSRDATYFLRTESRDYWGRLLEYKIQLKNDLNLLSRGEYVLSKEWLDNQLLEVYSIVLQENESVAITLNVPDDDHNYDVYLFKPSSIIPSPIRISAGGPASDESIAYTADITGCYCLAILNSGPLRHEYLNLRATYGGGTLRLNMTITMMQGPDDSPILMDLAIEPSDVTCEVASQGQGFTVEVDAKIDNLGSMQVDGVEVSIEARDIETLDVLASQTVIAGSIYPYSYSIAHATLTLPVESFKVIVTIDPNRRTQDANWNNNMAANEFHGYLSKVLLDTAVLDGRSYNMYAYIDNGLGTAQEMTTKYARGDSSFVKFVNSLEVSCGGAVVADPDLVGRVLYAIISDGSFKDKSTTYVSQNTDWLYVETQDKLIWSLFLELLSLSSWIDRFFDLFDQTDEAYAVLTALLETAFKGEEPKQDTVKNLVGLTFSVLGALATGLDVGESAGIPEVKLDKIGQALPGYDMFKKQFLTFRNFGNQYGKWTEIRIGNALGDLTTLTLRRSIGMTAEFMMKSVIEGIVYDVPTDSDTYDFFSRLLDSPTADLIEEACQYYNRDSISGEELTRFVNTKEIDCLNMVRMLKDLLSRTGVSRDAGLYEALSGVENAIEAKLRGDREGPDWSNLVAEAARMIGSAAAREIIKGVCKAVTAKLVLPTIAAGCIAGAVAGWDIGLQIANFDSIKAQLKVSNLASGLVISRLDRLSYLMCAAGVDPFYANTVNEASLKLEAEAYFGRAMSIESYGWGVIPHPPGDLEMRSSGWERLGRASIVESVRFHLFNEMVSCLDPAILPYVAPPDLPLEVRGGIGNWKLGDIGLGPINHWDVDVEIWKVKVGNAYLTTIDAYELQTLGGIPGRKGGERYDFIPESYWYAQLTLSNSEITSWGSTDSMISTDNWIISPSPFVTSSNGYFGDPFTFLTSSEPTDFYVGFKRVYDVFFCKESRTFWGGAQIPGYDFQASGSLACESTSEVIDSSQYGSAGGHDADAGVFEIASSMESPTISLAVTPWDSDGDFENEAATVSVEIITDDTSNDLALALTVRNSTTEMAYFYKSGITANAGSGFWWNVSYWAEESGGYVFDATLLDRNHSALSSAASDSVPLEQASDPPTTGLAWSEFVYEWHDDDFDGVTDSVDVAVRTRSTSGDKQVTLALTARNGSGLQIASDFQTVVASDVETTMSCSVSSGSLIGCVVSAWLVIDETSSVANSTVVGVISSQQHARVFEEQVFSEQSDIDLDGLCDILYLTVGLTPPATDYYHLSAEIYLNGQPAIRTMQLVLASQGTVNWFEIPIDGNVIGCIGGVAVLELRLVTLSGTDDSLIAAHSSTYSLTVDCTDYASKGSVISVTGSDIDGDGDGRLEAVEFSVVGYLLTSGYYSCSMDVVGDGGYLIASGIVENRYCERGVNTFRVIVPGSVIRGLGITTALHVLSTVIAHEGRLAILGVFDYSTRTYSPGMFEEDFASLGSAVSVRGLDDGEDGLFDWLVVEFPVAVYVQGEYSFAVAMETDEGETIGFPISTFALSTGTQMVQAKCTGSTIFLMRHNGSFRCLELTVTQLGVVIDSMTCDNASDSYEYDQFEPPCVMVGEGGVLDQGIDLDLDGMFDCLQVDVPITVTVEGQYLLSANLYNRSMLFWDTASVNAQYALGESTATFRFFGINKSLFVEERFMLQVLSIWTSSGDSVPVSGSLTFTGSYDSAQFESISGAYVLTVQLRPGWNIISVPVLGSPVQASSLGLQTGDIVSRWDSAAQSYSTSYVVGISSTEYDFQLMQGESYMVWSRHGQALTFVGAVPSLLESFNQSFDVPAKGGWIPVGFVSLNTTWTASDLASCVEGAEPFFVVRIDSDTGVYELFILGVSPSSYDFEIEPGRGYWIWVDGPCSISYSP